MGTGETKPSSNRKWENILIEGILKEAAQDNSDFEAAMLNISEEEFDEIIKEGAVADSSPINYCLDLSVSKCCNRISEENRTLEKVADELIIEKSDEAYSSRINHKFSREPELPIAYNKRNGFSFRSVFLWITGISAIAAVILFVFILRFNYIDGKLCDGAVYMSEAYVAPSEDGLNLYSASTDQIEKALPELERRCSVALEDDYTGQVFPENDMWNLAVAYLRLHKKDDAIRVLRVLESHTLGTPMGDHCKKLLEELD